MSDFAVKDLTISVLPETGSRDCGENTAICPEPPTAPDCFAGTQICPEPPTKPDCFAGTQICPEPPTRPEGVAEDGGEELRALADALERILDEG